MNKVEKIILLAFLAIIAFGVLANKVANAPIDSLGNLFIEPSAYTTASTYASSTMSAVSTATLIIPAATSSRTYAKVCEKTGVAIAWIYQQSTSTGVVVNMGTPIIASSTYPQMPNCWTADRNNPYLGQVWWITSGSSTVVAEYIQE